VLAALASPPATKALDPDLFSRHSLRHAVYGTLLHFGIETAINLQTSPLHNYRRANLGTIVQVDDVIVGHTNAA